MRIAVCMKQTPQLEQLRFRDREPVLTDVPWTFGSIDKNALEAAVQVKDSAEAEVVLLSVGGEEVTETAKEALAAGADSAWLVADEAAQELDSAQVAEALAALVNDIGEIDLVFTGEGSGDGYSGQVGSRVAEILGWAQVGYVRSIQAGPGKVVVTRAGAGTTDTLEVELPAVLTFAGDVNEPRIPSVMQVLKAGRKPQEVLELDDMSLDAGDRVVSVVSNLAPRIERKQVKVDDFTSLVQQLKTDGVIG